MANPASASCPLGIRPLPFALMLCLGALVPVVAERTGASAAAGQPIQAKPPRDTRLSRRVREEQLGSPLRDYLHMSSSATGVGQHAAPPFDDRPAAALNVDASLNRLQRILARTYHLTWIAGEQSPPEYSLVCSKANRQERADALAAARRRGRERMHARWEEVRRMAFMPPGRLAALAPGGDLKARTLQHPRTAALTRLAFQLPAPILRQFESRGFVSVPVSSLSPPLQQLATAAMGNERFEINTSDGRTHEVRSESIRDGFFMLSTGGTPDRPTAWACLRYYRDTPGGIDGNLLDSTGFLRQPPEERRREARGHPHSPVDDPRLQKLVSLRDPASPKGGEGGERPRGANPLAAFLKELAAQVELPIAAECDYRPKDARWLRDQWWLAEDILAKPLCEALDLLCADFEYEWELYEGALLLRPRLWFMEPQERGYVKPGRSITAVQPAHAPAPSPGR